MVAKALPGMDIGDVDFDHRQTAAFDGVMQRHRCVGERTWVEHRTERQTIPV